MTRNRFAIAVLAVFWLPASAAILHVSPDSSSPTLPYADWSTAAHTIQEAVDAAQAGDTVLVTNGVYATGGRAATGLTTLNRAAIDRAITVQSANGSEVTVIDGANATRCTYVGGGAILSGFTLTRGFVGGESGGGVWCASDGVVTNCTLTANHARHGGGASGGTLYDCKLSGNNADRTGGGASSCTLYACTLTGNVADIVSGGGASGSTLHNCTLTGNSAEDGGGAAECVLYNCTLTNNSCGRDGGGVYGGTNYNCTFAANSAGIGGGAFGGVFYNCTLTGNVADSGGGVSRGTLYNCILTGNSASVGGGVQESTLSNCTLSSNLAHLGGGAFGGTLTNCILTRNSAFSGGGAYSGANATPALLNNCILTGNTATNGGGTYSGVLNNCIVYYNTAAEGPNYYSSDAAASIFAYSCTTPLPSGLGNLETEPLLASATHLSAQSPCIGRGSAANTSGVDIDGEAWQNPPCIGADQFVSGQTTGPLTVSLAAGYTYVRTNFVVLFQALIEGRLAASVWDFGDGVVVSNRPYSSHAWAAAGQYVVRLTGYNDSYPSGVSATVMVQVTATEMLVYYVNAANATPVFPYSNWAGAATNIQDAIAAGTQIGRLVLVTNGLYGTGGRTMDGVVTNRVVVPDGVELRSVNGPAVTVIAGGGIRCAYVGANAVLDGLTLTNGYAMGNGGGVWSEVSGIVTNCILSGNVASNDGGGAYGGTLNNCTLSTNSASVGGGGGASGGTLNHCTLNGNSAYFGGGATYATLNYCTLSGNSSHGGYGGGSDGATLNYCVLSDNAALAGGGAFAGTLNHCTLIGNRANIGGGAHSAALNNCIVYFNSGNDANYSGCTLNYCCTTPLPAVGTGNIALDPMFVDIAGRDLHLQSTSPCINAGNNALASGETDLAGNPRIVGGTVDIGAYEYQGPGSMVSYAWLERYGLPTDGSADFIDTDKDGMSNRQEWICGTDPTQALSVLRMLSAAATDSNVTVSWQSVAGVNYFLERSSDLASTFTLVTTNIIGQAGNTAYIGAKATGAAPSFYRVGVKSK